MFHIFTTQSFFHFFSRLLLGIDPTTEVFDAQNRPLPLANGVPILDLIA